MGNYTREEIEKALAVLSKDDDVNVRRMVATHNMTPPTVLREMIDDNEDYDISIDAMNNKNMPLELFWELAKSDNSRYRELAAGTTNVEILQYLSTDKEPWVRADVAFSKYTPADILMNLASDPDQNVRWNLVNNLIVPREVLEILSHDIDKDIRKVASYRIRKRKKRRKKSPINTVDNVLRITILGLVILAYVLLLIAKYKST